MKTIKKVLTVLLLIFTHSAFSQMILEYDIATANTEIAVPLWGTVNASVDWGDGSPAELVTTTSNVPHTYTTVGTKTVTITGSVTTYGIAFNEFGNARLKKVLSWDGLGITSFNGAFAGAKLLIEVPTTLPPEVTDLSDMLNGATSFNQSIDSWDVSKVTSLKNMFYNASSFNQPLNSWNTIAVKNMESVFNRARAFNQPLNAWNTASVTTMRTMFMDATVFNQPLVNWNTGAVKDMFGMFRNADTFNQPLSGWNTSAVTDMSWMFADTFSFNENINDWNTASVIKMHEMFSNARSFNQPIGSWNTSAVQLMSNMFYSAKQFNQPIGTWNTSSLTTTHNMFAYAESFNQPLQDWNTMWVNDMRGMFANAKAFNQFIGKWNVSNVNGFGGMGGMFDGVPLCTNVYDDLLFGWSTQNVKTGMKLDLTTSKHSASSAAAKALLESKGWTITDGGIGITEDVKCIENSIGDMKIAKVNVYPNPVSDKLHITLDEKGSFALYNNLGQEVFRSNELNNINLRSLERGTYTYSIQVTNKVYTGKLILE